MSDKITLRDAFGQPFEVPAEEGPGGTLIPLQKVQVSGSSAAGESDQTGTGNGTAEFSTAVRFVDVYNGGSGPLTISAGGVTRVVPPGPRLCEFPQPTAEFDIVADGAWIATPME